MGDVVLAAWTALCPKKNVAPRARVAAIPAGIANRRVVAINELVDVVMGILVLDWDC